MADNQSGIWAKARDRRLFAVTETTYGTRANPSATDAFRALTGIISSPQPNRVDRDDNRPSRSREALILGNTPPGAWSYEGYLIPSGSNGTPPDVHALLIACLGVDSYANTGSTKDVYALTDTAQNRASVSLYEAYPAGGATDKHNVMMQSLFGAVVSAMTIKGGGGDPPTIAFSGVGASYRLTGRTTVNDATPTGSTITVSDPNAMQVGSLVAFLEAADGTTLVTDNSGTGFPVTAISGNDVTFDSSPVGLADGDIIAPWCPTETTAGTPISGTQTTMTVEGVSVSPIAWELTLENNDVPHDTEAGQSEMTGYHENKRDLSGQFTIRAKASDVDVLTRRKDIGNTTIQIVLGPGNTGASLQIDMEVQLQVSDIEAAPDDTVIMVLPIKGIATAANAKDELTLTFGDAS